MEIIGDDDQMLHVTLKPEQQIWAEPGVMVHCANEIKSFVSGGTGCFQALKRSCATGSAWRVHWKNTDPSKDNVLGLAAHFPGKVVPIKMEEWNGEVFVKQDHFLAAMDPDLEFNVERAKGGAACCGGAGFILQKLNGRGWVFLNAGGAVFSKTLQPGESMAVNRNSVVAWEGTIEFSFRMAGNLCMMCCGGEGLTESVLTGPGKVVIQSMPFETVRELFATKAKKGKDSKDKK